jgi:hypothetical protein
MERLTRPWSARTLRLTMFLQSATEAISPETWGVQPARRQRSIKISSAADTAEGGQLDRAFDPPVQGWRGA